MPHSSIITMNSLNDALMWASYNVQTLNVVQNVHWTLLFDWVNVWVCIFLTKLVEESRQDMTGVICDLFVVRARFKETFFFVTMHANKITREIVAYENFRPRIVYSY